MTRETFFSSRDLRHAFRRRIDARSGNRFQRMRQHSQFIRNRHADPRPTEIDPEHAPHDGHFAHCNSSGILPIRCLIFSAW